MFPARGPKNIAPKVITRSITLLYVGTWSLQKGCDLLEAAVSSIDGVRLTHVGAIGDFRFPQCPERFAHHGPVVQSELKHFYEAADLFVLASRQDGFGMVLSQALASGLPVICTDHTGGGDLAEMPGFACHVTVVPSDNADALAAAIRGWRDRLRGGHAPPPLGETERQMLSWTAYARRYNAELLRMTEGAVR
jgi:glycosyltransferase involved in cell wall biosynthesis